MTFASPHHLRTPAEPLQPHPDTSFYVVISSGVTSSGLTQDATVGEDVLSGGLAISNTVGSGGLVIVENGGTTRSDTVLSGGIEQLSSGAVASSLAVSAGGLISGPGVIASGTVEGYGVGFTVGSSGDFFDNVGVQSGGLVSSIAVDALGILNVNSGGTAEAVTIIEGAVTVGDGGILSGVSISSGGLLLAQGGLTQGATVLTYGQMEVGSSTSSGTGSATGVSVGYYGKLDVLAGGLVSGVGVYHSGAAEVHSGGVTSRATVAGGTLTLDTGAQVYNTTVNSGGLLNVGHAAVASGVILQSGTISCASFGEVIGITASSGTTISGNIIFADGGDFGYAGRREVAARISGDGLIVEEGGGVMVLDGSLSGFTGEITLAGGTVELDAAGAINAHDVHFSDQYSSGAVNTLQLDAADQPVSGATFTPVISGWSAATDRIDFAGRALVSGATSARLVGDVLTVKDGTYTAKFILAGQHASRYVVASDGHGGTLVRAVVPPATQAAPAADQGSIVQAAAAFGVGSRNGSWTQVMSLAEPHGSLPAITADLRPVQPLRT